MSPLFIPSIHVGSPIIVKVVALGSPGSGVGPEALRSLSASFLVLDCDSKSNIFVLLGFISARCPVQSLISGFLLLNLT